MRFSESSANIQLGEQSFGNMQVFDGAFILPTRRPRCAFQGSGCPLAQQLIEHPAFPGPGEADDQDGGRDKGLLVHGVPPCCVVIRVIWRWERGVGSARPGSPVGEPRRDGMSGSFVPQGDAIQDFRQCALGSAAPEKPEGDVPLLRCCADIVATRMAYVLLEAIDQVVTVKTGMGYRVPSGGNAVQLNMRGAEFLELLDLLAEAAVNEYRNVLRGVNGARNVFHASTSFSSIAANSLSR